MSLDNLNIEIDIQEVEIIFETVATAELTLNEDPNVIILASSNIGAPGPQGVAGIQGPPGEDSIVPGPTGPEGPEGPIGLTGLTGADSTVPGPQGPEGPEGPEGPIGADSTVPGPPGSPGDDGDQGIQGIQGPTGPPGADGEDGAPGIQGPEGPEGPPGTDGADSTVPGPQGIPGEDGDQGIQGPEGPPGADSTVAGPQGIPGEDGDQGIQGPEGPEGPEGPQGIPGPDGKASSPNPTSNKLKAWTYDPIHADSGAAGTAGLLLLNKILIPEDISITQLLAWVVASYSGTPTAALAGLYDGSGHQTAAGVGVRHSITASQIGQWNSTGLKEMNLTPDSGRSLNLIGGTDVWMYAAFLQAGGTNQVGFTRYNQAARNNIGLVAADGYRFGQLAAQTGLPATLTLTALAVSAVPVWAGLR